MTGIFAHLFFTADLLEMFVIEIKFWFMFLESCNCTTVWLNTTFKTDKLREECALVL